MEKKKVARIRNYCRVMGRRGEAATADFLQEQGWDILCRNFQAGKQELDIVARNEGVLHFIEVKTRRMRPLSFPAMAVNFLKRRNIIMAAKSYIRQLGNIQIQHQYDIAEVLTRDGRILSINMIENAFSDKAKKAHEI